MGAKQELLQQAEQEYDGLKAAIKGLDEAQMSQVWLGTWGVREILAHATGWLASGDDPGAGADGTRGGSVPGRCLRRFRQLERAVRGGPQGPVRGRHPAGAGGLAS